MLVYAGEYIFVTFLYVVSIIWGAAAPWIMSSEIDIEMSLYSC